MIIPFLGMYPSNSIIHSQTLGFEEYIDAVQEVFNEHKEQAKDKSRGIKRLKNQDIPEEELRLQQQELFERARSALRNSQLGLDTSTGAMEDANTEYSVSTESQDINSIPVDTTPSITPVAPIVLSAYTPLPSTSTPDEEEDDELDDF